MLIIKKLKKEKKEKTNLKKNKDVKTSESCDHVHLGTSALQVNERDTGEQAGGSLESFQT